MKHKSTEAQIEANPPPRYLTLAAWARSHTYPSAAQLRGLLRRAIAGTKGLDGLTRCVRRVGGRWLVVEHELIRWIDSRIPEAPVARRGRGGRRGGAR